MATDVEFIQYVCEQIRGTGDVSYKKMFGEYMAYVNSKPVLLVCDNTVYVKQLDAIKDLMTDAEKGTPYNGAKEHFILDIDDRELSEKVVAILEEITPLPKKRSTAKKNTQN
ncbi:MAG: transcriptional regulator [Clostridia bacterium]|nr:transcriptional regulator [Clostridia bacterium]